MWQLKTFVDDDNYSNFSLVEMMRDANKKAIERKKDLASGQLRTDLDTSRTELQNTKAELEKTKQDIEQLKSVTNKVIEQKSDNLPQNKNKMKIPLIIGGVLVLSIGAFLLIKKMNK